MDRIPVVVTGARPYKFTNDDGEQIEGLSVHYFTLEPPTGRDQHVGYLPQKVSLPYDEWDKTYKNMKLPAKCSADFTINLNNARNPFKITGFEFLKQVAI